MEEVDITDSSNGGSCLRKWTLIKNYSNNMSNYSNINDVSEQMRALTKSPCGGTSASEEIRGNHGMFGSRRFLTLPLFTELCIVLMDELLVSGFFTGMGVRQDAAVGPNVAHRCVPLSHRRQFFKWALNVPLLCPQGPRTRGRASDTVKQRFVLTYPATVTMATATIETHRTNSERKTWPFCL